MAHQNPKYKDHPVYKAEYARRMARSGDAEMANLFATSKARWASATRGMTVQQEREFADALNKAQQETWNREERDWPMVHDDE